MNDLQKPSPREKRVKWSHSLRTKIATGFAVVLALHISIAIIGHVGLNRAKAGLAEYNAGRLVTLHSVEIDRLVRELQSTARDFTHTGHGSVHSHFRDICASLEGEFEAVAKVASDADMSIFDEIAKSLIGYREKFELAVENRLRRSGIVARLERTSKAVRANLNAIGEYLAGPADLVNLASINEIERSFNAAARHTRAYLAHLDSRDIQRASRHASTCTSLLDGLEPSLAGQPGLLQETKSAIRDFDRFLPQIVESTRTYLHLIHVVLAGKAAAILRSSGAFRQSHLQGLDALYRGTQADQDAFQLLSVVISIVTILLGLIASGLIARVVANPLVRITETFNDLARGRTAATIPGRNRGDEIGHLADAAQVFHDKNVETAALLAETQRLAAKGEAVIVDLEAKNAELDSFAHVAAHDLRAPIRAMSTLISFLEEDCEHELGDTGRAHVASLKQRVHRMKSLVEDLLTFARMGRDNFDALPIRSFQAVDRAIANCAVPEDFRVIVSGDDCDMTTQRIPLEMVLGNLISNAIKHHDRGGGIIEICVEDRGETCAFRVSDDGPGIPEAHRDKIFQPFQTLKRRDEVEASGIGLALVRSLVDRFGKSIAVSDVVGRRGTCFSFEWPARVQASTTVEGVQQHVAHA